MAYIIKKGNTTCVPYFGNQKSIPELDLDFITYEISLEDSNTYNGKYLVLFADLYKIVKYHYKYSNSKKEYRRSYKCHKYVLFDSCEIVSGKTKYVFKRNIKNTKRYKKLKLCKNKNINPYPIIFTFIPEIVCERPDSGFYNTLKSFTRFTKSYN